MKKIIAALAGLVLLCAGCTELLSVLPEEHLFSDGTTKSTLGDSLPPELENRRGTEGERVCIKGVWYIWVQGGWMMDTDQSNDEELDSREHDDEVSFVKECYMSGNKDLVMEKFLEWYYENENTLPFSGNTALFFYLIDEIGINPQLILDRSLVDWGQNALDGLENMDSFRVYLQLETPNHELCATILGLLFESNVHVVTPCDSQGSLSVFRTPSGENLGIIEDRTLGMTKIFGNEIYICLNTAAFPDLLDKAQYVDVWIEEVFHTICLLNGSLEGAKLSYAEFLEDAFRYIMYRSDIPGSWHFIENGYNRDYMGSFERAYDNWLGNVDPFELGNSDEPGFLSWINDFYDAWFSASRDGVPEYAGLAKSPVPDNAEQLEAMFNLVYARNPRAVSGLLDRLLQELSMMGAYHGPYNASTCPERVEEYFAEHSSYSMEYCRIVLKGKVSQAFIRRLSYQDNSFGFKIMAYVVSDDDITLYCKTPITSIQCISGEMGVTSVVLPGSLKTIMNGTFARNAMLDNVVIPSGVRNIGSSVFANCSSLRNVNFEGFRKNIKFGADVFKNCPCGDLSVLDRLESMSSSGALLNEYVRNRIVVQGYEETITLATSPHSISSGSLSVTSSNPAVSVSYRSGRAVLSVLREGACSTILTIKGDDLDKDYNYPIDFEFNPLASGIDKRIDINSPGAVKAPLQIKLLSLDKTFLK